MSTTDTAAQRKSWADRFLPAQIKIIADHFQLQPSQIQIANHDQDYYEATDLILPDQKRVAVRVRRHGQKQYSNEIAFRSRKIADDIPNEYQKVRSGHGDFALTCWCDEAETTIDIWHLVDLAEFRRAARGWYGGYFPYTLWSLEEEGKGLISFDLSELASRGFDLVLARLHPEHGLREAPVDAGDS